MCFFERFRLFIQYVSVLVLCQLSGVIVASSCFSVLPTRMFSVINPFYCIKFVDSRLGKYTDDNSHA